MKDRRRGTDRRRKRFGLSRLTRRDLDRADRISWVLLIFAAVRVIAWVAMMVFVALGLIGLAPFKWASHVAELVVFVTFISFYANAATDFGTLTAAWAAVRAGRAHRNIAQVEAEEEARQVEMLKRIEALTEAIRDEQLRSEKE